MLGCNLSRPNRIDLCAGTVCVLSLCALAYTAHATMQLCALKLHHFPNAVAHKSRSVLHHNLFHSRIFWCVLHLRSATVLSDDDSENVSREASPCSESPQPLSMGYESPLSNNVHSSVMASTSMSKCNATMVDHAKVCLCVCERRVSDSIAPLSDGFDQISNFFGCFSFSFAANGCLRLLLPLKPATIVPISYSTPIK